MLKSQILEKLHQKYNNFSLVDIENIFDLFIKKMTLSLKEGRNIEIRGFGTFSRKINKEKYVRNPKSKSYKVHFKIGKTLHKRLNSNYDDLS